MRFGPVPHAAKGLAQALAERGQAHRPEASGRIGLHNQLADLGVQFLHPGWLIALALPRRNLRVVNIIIAPVRTAAWGIDHRRQKRSSQPGRSAPLRSASRPGWHQKRRSTNYMPGPVIAGSPIFADTLPRLGERGDIIRTRSAERRVGTERVSTCRSRWSTYI